MLFPPTPPPVESDPVLERLFRQSARLRTKTSGLRVRVSEDSSHWTQEAHDQLLQQHPWLASASLRPNISLLSPEGAAVGYFHVTARNIPPAAAGTESINVVAIPIIIRDFSLYPFKVFVWKEQMYPLTQDRVQPLLQLRDLFSPVTNNEVEQLRRQRKNISTSPTEAGNDLGSLSGAVMSGPVKFSSSGLDVLEPALVRCLERPFSTYKVAQSSAKVTYEDFLAAALERVAPETRAFEIQLKQSSARIRAAQEGADGWEVTPWRDVGMHELPVSDVVKASLVYDRRNLVNLNSPEQILTKKSARTPVPPAQTYDDLVQQVEGKLGAFVKLSKSPDGPALAGVAVPVRMAFTTAPSRWATHGAAPATLRTGLLTRPLFGGPLFLEQGGGVWRASAEVQFVEEILPLAPTSLFLPVAWGENFDSSWAVVFPYQGRLVSIVTSSDMPPMMVDGVLRLNVNNYQDIGITVEILPRQQATCPVVIRLRDGQFVFQIAEGYAAHNLTEKSRFMPVAPEFVAAWEECAPREQPPALPVEETLALEGQTVPAKLACIKTSMSEEERWVLSEATGHPDLIWAGSHVKTSGSAEDMEWTLACLGMSGSLVKAAMAVARTEGQTGVSIPVRPVPAGRRDRVLEATNAASTTWEKFSAWAQHCKLDASTQQALSALKKQSASTAGPAVDTVLQLGFINETNLMRFVEMIPELEKALSYLCALLVASYIGLDEVSEQDTEAAIQGLDRVLGALRVLDHSLRAAS